MTKSNLFSPRLALAAACALGIGVPAAAQSDIEEGAKADRALAAQPLAAGDADDAITMLKAALRSNPDDPALLINLGIAQAQSGDLASARRHFRAAMATRDIMQLETADGRTISSRKLARNALAMLERGEFGVEAQPGQLTLRD
ncbi:tetratricopeptide repeat protein [Erythrobacter sp.]|jgi:Tfp pilus assembly protein PilF|uniref:tetratricopeptide repeat protein n=1 Tax=Erythrobacter sp. TaxID=1042 RepID=UPI002EBABD20|nr:tetratricopeptide repeat protein [Erythrobacter sp.]